VLLKTADILHCDNSRIPEVCIDPGKLKGIDLKKYLMRYCTNGWRSDGSRIWIQVAPKKKEEFDAVAECFKFMKNSEWPAVADALERYFFPHVLELDQDKSKILFREYLDAVVTETGRIDIRGIFSQSGMGREAIHFAIEDMYTPLNTGHPREDRAAPENGGPMTEAIERRVPLTDLLAKRRPLLIIGDPGGGKTTFLRLIACVSAKDAQGRTDPERQRLLGLPLAQSAPIPIFLRLAALADVLKDRCNEAGCGSSWRFIEKALEQIHGPALGGMLCNLLDTGKCALLLDGLDEVADESLRRRLVDVVNSALGKWERNIILLTSRRYGYQDIADTEKISVVYIDAFGDEEITEFLKRWGDGIYPENEAEKRRSYVAELSTAIIDSPAIRKLARNPVMLTCLCVVHWNERRLPEGKADLLLAVLRWLLNAKEEKRKNRGYDNTFAEECFKALAFSMTNHPDGKQVIVDLAWAASQLTVPFCDIRGIVDKNKVQREGMRFFEEEMIDSGIVEKYETGQIRFWHLNFQEHYAARALMDRSDDQWWQIIQPRLWNRQWSEVLDHLAGCLASTGRYRPWLLVENILGTAKENDLPSIARAVGVLGRILRILEAYKYYPPARLGWKTALDKVMGIFTPDGAKRVPVEERIVAAEALGQAGDPRINPLNPEMKPVPGMESVWLGTYPVTVEEFARFVENGGYGDRSFWDDDGWSEKEKQGWTKPDEWDDQMEHRNRPVTGVSWYEACAYCKWLTAAQTRHSFRLPKSREWEKAATHPAGEYPWGKKEPDKELCNFGGNVGCPTPVGVYPAGAAPGGHLDMSGNVWEWNYDLYKKGVADRVIRGGSWISVAQSCRSAIRYFYRPGNRGGTLGFRLSRSVALVP
ncbi:MAG: SUMF1/EgtB/PvdO family nonheme iron enzyme, partial [Desulfosalsimonadaceae bacterium]|nr:SUMF1/EgtB/PvdO family nonheme iron enzyme [Desulfosalsimonadaceae bacterium]